jgi:hypothetical protein
MARDRGPADSTMSECGYADGCTAERPSGELRPTLNSRQMTNTLRDWELNRGNTKANKTPTAKLATASPSRIALTRLSLRQVRAATGSEGHGSERPYQSAAPLAMSNPAATPNNSGLCSLSQTSWATAATNPASAAPAPSTTGTAGNTQQRIVAELVSYAAADRAALRVNACHNLHKIVISRWRALRRQNR